MILPALDCVSRSSYKRYLRYRLHLFVADHCPGRVHNICKTPLSHRLVCLGDQVQDTFFPNNWTTSSPHVPLRTSNSATTILLYAVVVLAAYCFWEQVSFWWMRYTAALQAPASCSALQHCRFNPHCLQLLCEELQLFNGYHAKQVVLDPQSS